MKNFAILSLSKDQVSLFLVAVARRRNGSDGVTMGTVAAARDGYRKNLARASFRACWVSPCTRTQASTNAPVSQGQTVPW